MRPSDIVSLAHAPLIKRCGGGIRKEAVRLTSGLESQRLQVGSVGSAVKGLAAENTYRLLGRGRRGDLRCQIVRGTDLLSMPLGSGNANQCAKADLHALGRRADKDKIVIGPRRHIRRASRTKYQFSLRQTDGFGRSTMRRHKKHRLHWALERDEISWRCRRCAGVGEDDWDADVHAMASTFQGAGRHRASAGIPGGIVGDVRWDLFQRGSVVEGINNRAGTRRVPNKRHGVRTLP